MLKLLSRRIYIAHAHIFAIVKPCNMLLFLLPLLMISCIIGDVVAGPCELPESPVITCQMGQYICNTEAYKARVRFRYPDGPIPKGITPTCSATFIDDVDSGNLCCNPSQICSLCMDPNGIACHRLECSSAKPILRGDPCAAVSGYYRQSLCRRHDRPIDIPNLHRPIFLPPFWANDPSYHERYPLYPEIYKRELENATQPTSNMTTDKTATTTK